MDSMSVHLGGQMATRSSPSGTNRLIWRKVPEGTNFISQPPPFAEAIFLLSLGVENDSHG